MDRNVLLDLLRTETDRVEWKESLSDGSAISRTVCALANDLGATGRSGYLVVGVRRDGKVQGIDTTRQNLDEAQQKLANRLRDITLQPSPSVHGSFPIRRRSWSSGGLPRIGFPVLVSTSFGTAESKWTRR